VRRRKPARRGVALTRAAIQQLVDALSPSDALDCGEEEQRRAALSALSRREDPEAIALLRRAAAGHDQDLALSAALILDDVGERAERRTDPRDPGGAA
jgi:HEAT repeat protein